MHLVVEFRSPRENIVSSSTQPSHRSGGSASSTPTANGSSGIGYIGLVKKEASSTTTPGRKDNPQNPSVSNFQFMLVLCTRAKESFRRVLTQFLHVFVVILVWPISLAFNVGTFQTPPYSQRSTAFLLEVLA